MLVINIKGLEDVVNTIINLRDIFSDKNFIEFIKRKCMLEVKYQTDTRLTSLVDLNSALLSNYRNNHKTVDTDRGFILYNDLTNDEWLKYDFSIAQAVEYGVGVRGIGTGITAEDDGYEYDVNDHGESGWVYMNENEEFIWTAGYSGRNVYYFTYLEILNKMEIWIYEFIESELS